MFGNSMKNMGDLEPGRIPERIPNLNSARYFDPHTAHRQQFWPQDLLRAEVMS